MQYFKNINDKIYIQWNVESGSGFLTVVTQVSRPAPASGSLEPDGGKMININFLSGSVNSFPPIGQQINNWENRQIKNPNLVTIDKEEYDTFLSLACTNVQTDWIL
jgi:hypothetical protein